MTDAPFSFSGLNEPPLRHFDAVSGSGRPFHYKIRDTLELFNFLPVFRPVLPFGDHPAVKLLHFLAPDKLQTGGSPPACQVMQ